METKVITYIRVSTDDQKTSLAVQELRLQEYCKFKNFEIVSTIIDEDVSGGKPFYERPGGKVARSHFDKGVKTIVVLKTDRIFRSVKDSLITVDEWEKEGISLNIVDMGGNSLDVKTAMGRMFFIQAVSMGELERRLAGERTKAVLSHKKKQGAIYCGEIYGFDKVGGERIGKKLVGAKLVKNDFEQTVIDEIFEMNSDQYNNNEIAVILNSRGIKTKNGKAFQGSTVQSILNNPIHKQVA